MRHHSMRMRPRVAHTYQHPTLQNRALQAAQPRAKKHQAVLPGVFAPRGCACMRQ